MMLRVAARRVAALLVAVLVCGGRGVYGAEPAAADFKAGQTAYAAGDYARAARVWQPLAERGDAQAQYGMGMLARRGLAGPRDAAAAAQWWRKAANQGHTASQFNLGVL
ncbi:MAG TPA: hypothetical protein PLZ79_05890 [Burkholderiales bacterium]|nr:hypothetical protein [Burkholderiales bacterium]